MVSFDHLVDIVGKLSEKYLIIELMIMSMIKTIIVKLFNYDVKDEVEVVSRLEIESLVNSAQCPTRVEASVATKDQVKIMTMVMMMTMVKMTLMKGLREGYKWLVKSVITNYLELGTRVSEDMAREAAEEEERRKEVRN